MRFMLIPKVQDKPEGKLSLMEYAQELHMSTPPQEVRVRFSNGVTRHIRLNEAHSSPNNTVEVLEHQDRVTLVELCED